MLKSFKQLVHNHKSYFSAKMMIDYGYDYSSHNQNDYMILGLYFKSIFDSGIDSQDMCIKLFNKIPEKFNGATPRDESRFFSSDFILIYTQAIITNPTIKEKEFVEFLYKESLSCIAKICDNNNFNKKEILSYIGASMVLSVLKTRLAIARENTSTVFISKEVDNKFFDLYNPLPEFNIKSILDSIMPALEIHGLNYQDIAKKIDSLRASNQEKLDTMNKVNIQLLNLFSNEEIYVNIFSGIENLDSLLNQFSHTAISSKEKEMLSTTISPHPVSSAKKNTSKV